MGTIYHDILDTGNRHALQDLAYANQVARKAGAGITSIHLDRIVEQEDDRSFWIISQTTPSIIMDPYVPPAPAVGDIGKVLGVVSDADSYVKFSWVSAGASLTYDDVYNNESGTHTIYVDDGDMYWELATTNSFEIDLSNNTGTADGFMVTNGTDQLDLIRKGANLLDLDGDFQTVEIDASVGISLDAVAASNFTVSGATADLTLGARGAAVTLNESGETLPDTTAQSIIGAINELYGMAGGSTFDDIYNNESGTHAVTMDDGDLSWNISGNYDFEIYIESAGPDHGFQVYDDTDYFRLWKGGGSIDLAAELEDITMNASGRTDIQSTSVMYLQKDAASGLYLFNSAADGETEDLRIYGYASGASLRYLSVACGSTADDMASFTGLSDYYFAGNVGVGVTPSYKFSVGSTDNSDQVGIYHDNTNAYFTTTDGNFIFETQEGPGTNTFIQVRGQGAGVGYIRIFDQDNLEELQLSCISGQGYIETTGTSPGLLRLQNNAHSDIGCFVASSEGETREVTIWGYRTSDSLRSLQIGVGINAADRVDFDGLSTYYFDGALQVLNGTTINEFSIDGTLAGNSDDALPTEKAINTFVTTVFDRIQRNAADLDIPNNADWAVNAAAGVAADSNNAGLNVRKFDDTVEQGVGLEFWIPSGATNIIVKTLSRAETAPGAARTVGLGFYNRGLPGAVDSWSSVHAMADRDIPTNENWLEDSDTIALSTLGMTAGEWTQVELTRRTPSGGTNLTDDWTLKALVIEFS